MKKCLCAVVLVVAAGGARTEATAGCAGIEAIDNSQAGWRVKADKVDLFITKSGAHMAPVRFCVDTKNPVPALLHQPVAKREP